MMWRLCWFMHSYVQPVTVLKQSVASFSKLNRPLLQKELKKKEKTKSPNCLPVEQKVAVYFLQELLCFPLCSAVWGNTDVETFHHELK